MGEGILHVRRRAELPVQKQHLHQVPRYIRMHVRRPQLYLAFDEVATGAHASQIRKTETNPS